MITLLAERFMENSDSSFILIKKINQEPADKYPTFSLCFNGANFHWYHDNNIFSTYGINATQFELMLKGEKAIRYEPLLSPRLYRKVPVIMKNATDFPLDQFYLQNTDFIQELHYVTNNEVNDLSYTKGINRNNDSRPAMYLSYQSAEMICYTRNSTDPLKSLRSYDLLTFNSLLISDGLYAETNIAIYIHYPGQLLWSFAKPFENPKWSSSFSDLFTQLKNNSNPKILEFEISQMRVLRKRENAEIPCNKGIQNYDDYLKEKIIEHLGCIPIYFTMSTLPNELILKECQTSDELAQAYNYLNNYRVILEANEKPCDELVFVSRHFIDSNPATKPKDISVKIQYTQDYFEEINYLEAFNFETFFSNVGGFVGIFLGYSIMQVPELIGYIFTLFLGKKTEWFLGKLMNNLN